MLATVLIALPLSTLANAPSGSNPTPRGNVTAPKHSSLTLMQVVMQFFGF